MTLSFSMFAITFEPINSKNTTIQTNLKITVKSINGGVTTKLNNQDITNKSFNH